MSNLDDECRDVDGVISSAPDQTNNILALAFGVFVAGLLVFGSMIIMAHLNHNMMPMDRLVQMQR